MTSKMNKEYREWAMMNPAMKKAHEGARTSTLAIEANAIYCAGMGVVEREEGKTWIQEMLACGAITARDVEAWEKQGIKF